jgi:chemotaxis protein CheX
LDGFDVTSPSDPPTLSLPAQLDLTAAPGLHRLLRETLESCDDLALDAGAVGVVTSPCLQVLAAAALGQRGRGHRLFVTSASPAFRRAVAELDLGGVLPIAETEVAPSAH